MKKEDLLINFLSFVTIIFLAFGIYYYVTEIKPLQNQADNSSKEEDDNSNQSDEITIRDDLLNEYLLKAKLNDSIVNYEILTKEKLSLLKSTAIITGDYNIQQFSMKIHNVASTADITYLGIEYLIPSTKTTHQYIIVGINGEEVTTIINIGMGDLVFSRETGEEFQNYIIENNQIYFYYKYGKNSLIDDYLEEGEEIYFLRLSLTETNFLVDEQTNPHDDMIVS